MTWHSVFSYKVVFYEFGTTVTHNPTNVWIDFGPMMATMNIEQDRELIELEYRAISTLKRSTIL